jgi:ribosomal-protein-alanine N-acetyltransferase
MSAVLKPGPRFEPMREEDLPVIVGVEEKIYEFPWTLVNFRDSLRSGYSCWLLREGSAPIGYAVLMLAAGEAHLLNLSIAPQAQGRGHGGRLLGSLIEVAREHGAKILFLEVRPSNGAGQQLYTSYGFTQVGVRRGYYPARHGREDALVLGLDL